MSEDQVVGRKLSSGEVVKLHHYPSDVLMSECWEATAFVTDVPGSPDRHALGDTPDEAIDHLERYVESLRYRYQAPLPSGWNPPETVPENGSEFEYLCTDGKVRVGSLGHDMGGSIKRDQRMIGWRERTRA